MPSRKKKTPATNSGGSSPEVLRDVLGHLNFSSGKPDPLLYRNINTLWEGLEESNKAGALREMLVTSLEQLHQSGGPFADTTQAAAVIDLTLTDCLHAYRAFHADLLFHLTEQDFQHPYLLASFFEAILAQGGPWDEKDRILDGALRYLNDYVGYRPVAVLENGRKMEIYPHERFRPVPLYVNGAGVAAGIYRDLIDKTLEFLRDTPPDLLVDSYFSLEHLDELSCDMRAYDHLNPVNKRTNYTFGEWDPHRIDLKGNYRRFVIRKIILDALVEWIETSKARAPREEKLFDAAAALCGTILMASSISGAGPQSHDSTVSLTVLLPVVARRRDAFYARLMSKVSGQRAKRLEREAKKTQQPFGHVRQYLNMRLAGYGARQVQHRELSHLYALMGFADASREQAFAIPAASIRFETEIECAISAANQELDQGRVEQAAAHLVQMPDLLKRGVECGALVDPWNILGFQGHFPLFQSREDAIPDNRIETLMDLMEGIFTVYSRSLGEAAIQGNVGLRERIGAVFQGLVEWWDRFGSDVIEDLPDVDGQENWESANSVADALTDWRAAGEAAGDITFWRGHVEKFQSARSYALVVNALLDKRDHVASLGLLMQWMSQVDDVGYESTQHSVFSLLIRLMKLVIDRKDHPLPAAERATACRRFFDFLEANAEEWWKVPSLTAAVDTASGKDAKEPPEESAPPPAGETEEGEGDLFEAAYDDVIFRDSTDDGQWGDTLDGDMGFRNTEFEAINRELEPKLKFINCVAQLWQMAAASLGADLHVPADSDSAQPALQIDKALSASVVNWHNQSQRWQIDMAELMSAIWDHEIAESSGDHDANVEYDIQLQVKFYLLHQVINTLICLRNAERMLSGVVGETLAAGRGSEQERLFASVYHAVIQRDAAKVREAMPAVLARLERNPLLYVPLENDGEPGQVLRTQALQSIVRFLLRELPRLGLLREGWHVLHTAYRMERNWRPPGQAITEFDRLFDISLRNTLEELVASARQWNNGSVDTEQLIDAIGRVLDPFQWLWSEHARTMRISAVDGMRRDEEWGELAEFIQTYGADLFHASQLTLGHVRAILHNGIDWFIDYLEAEQDPLNPIKLLDDIDAGVIDREDAEWCLEQIYSIIVDRFDRYLEYNTTTTQSDYGEMLFTLFEFLRLEARYDRDAWNLIPLSLVHECLARHQLNEAADVWESTFGLQTEDIARQHLDDLARLQRVYGMRMPTIADHLGEQFVKPLALNRILALVKQAVGDARQGLKSAAFATLQTEVEEYLKSSWGSGVDIPSWLRMLEREVSEATFPVEGGRPGAEAELDVPRVPITEADFQEQSRKWRESLGKTRRITGGQGSSGKTTSPRRRRRKPDETPPDPDA